MNQTTYRFGVRTLLSFLLAGSALTVLASGCGSSSAKGAGGGSVGGTPGIGGAGGPLGNGGAGGAPVGAGGTTAGLHLPPTGDVYCLQDAASADGAFYYGFNRQCTAVKKAGIVPATTAELQSASTYCTLIIGGTVVTACPAETPVAYCVGTGAALGSTLSLDVVRTIYQSAVTPDANAVARDAAAVCAAQATAVYDTAGHMVTGTCTGTLTASVDGVPVDFSKGLYCSYVSNGTEAIYFIRGSDDPQSIDLKTLSLSIFQDAMGIVSLQTLLGSRSPPQLAGLYPPVGYSEGSAATGVFPTPADPTMITYQSQAFDAKGAGLSGTFSIGGIKNGSAMRAITAGAVTITFPVQ